MLRRASDPVVGIGGPPQEETHFLHFCYSPSVTNTGPRSNDWRERWGLSWAVSNDVPCGPTASLSLTAADEVRRDVIMAMRCQGQVVS